MIQHIDASVPMRDGVRLSADVRYPEPGGPFPTILIRTPYGNSGFSTVEAGYIEEGYAVVKQDCRGRFDSEGIFRPMRDDADGFDTVAWVRRQPWCDGRVGMTGSSYSAFTQLAAAWTRPEGLLGITPSVMGNDLYREVFYCGGAFNLALAVGWGSGVAGRTGQTNLTTNWAEVYRHLPLITMDEAAGYHLPHLREWLEHPAYDDFWRAMSVEHHYAEFDTPAFHVGGWYDVYSAGVPRNFAGLRAHGRDRARRRQKLLMGPWVHGVNQRLVGQLDFGESAVIELETQRKRWLDRWVKGIENGIDREPPVRVFVMGVNRWRDEDDWPPPRARETDFFLAGDGAANSSFGDGVLSRSVNDGADTDAYVYNPGNPVPTLGGNCLRTARGPTDHAPLERRNDVLVYTSEVLREPLEVTGFVKMVLYAASDAPDTDFVARLCDVYPDERSIILCDGVLRARCREGFDREALMEPGKVYEFEIDMGVTANVFRPGHRVRLEVTSSCFPRWSRNQNTGAPLATDTELRLARQTIHHSRAYPSRVILPVVAGEGET